MIVYDKIEAGKRLTQIIKEAGLNSRQFALKIEGDPSYLAKMEKGNKGISRTYLAKIEKAFGISTQWLLFGTGGKKVPRELWNQQTDGHDSKAEEPEMRQNTPKTIAMQVLADIATANREIAESNNTLSKNQESILAKMPTVDVRQEITVDEAARWSNLLELLADVLIGKKQFLSKQEVLAELNKYVPLPRLGA